MILGGKKMIYAKDVNQNPVHILDANPGNTYTCISCNDELNLMQGTIKPWHFQHKENSDCMRVQKNPEVGCIFNLRGYATPYRKICKSDAYCQECKRCP